MKNLLIAVISIVSSFANVCESQPKMPEKMPEDCEIILAERNPETNKNQTISITGEFLTIQTGSGWHNRTKKQTKIIRQDAEKIYQILLDNNFDEIKNDSTGELNEKIDNSISIYSTKINLTVYQGILRLSPTNNERFENIRKAILEFAKKNNPAVEQ